MQGCHICNQETEVIELKQGWRTKTHSSHTKQDRQRVSLERGMASQVTWASNREIPGSEVPHPRFKMLIRMRHTAPMILLLNPPWFLPTPDTQLL